MIALPKGTLREFERYSRLAYGETMAYGSFNPLSFLLRTCAVDPQTIGQYFRQNPDNKAHISIPPKKVLIGLANLVHEYTHFLQMTTRFMALGLLGSIRQQAGWTYRLVSSLRRMRPRRYWPPQLPLLEYAFQLPRSVAGEWISHWVGFESIHRLIWGDSVLTREDKYGRFIDHHFREFYGMHKTDMLRLPEPLYPQIPTVFGSRSASPSTGASQEGPSRDLLPFDILENEANINAFLYLATYYGMRVASDVFRDMFGASSTVGRFCIALPWLHNGIAHLFPLAADLAFQGWSMKGRFENMHPSWRFLAAWEVCLAYRGCDSDGTFLRGYSDVVSDIRRKCRSPQPERFLQDTLAGRRHPGTIVSGDWVLSSLLSRNLRHRIKRPYWFYSPVVYFDYLMRNITVPFAIFANTPKSVFELGPAVARDQDTELYGNLFDEVFVMWSAREIATSSSVRCPLCEIIGERTCTGDCSFGQWFRHKWGFSHTRTE